MAGSSSAIIISGRVLIMRLKDSTGAAPEPHWMTLTLGDNMRYEKKFEGLALCEDAKRGQFDVVVVHHPEVRAERAPRRSR